MVGIDNNLITANFIFFGVGCVALCMRFGLNFKVNCTTPEKTKEVENGTSIVKLVKSKCRKFRIVELFPVSPFGLKPKNFCTIDGRQQTKCLITRINIGQAIKK